MDFGKILNKVLDLEGGLKIHKNKGEKDITYAGIYRKAHPNWKGWKYIDKGEKPPFELVKSFYYQHFYKPFEKIKSDKIKALLFETAVNVGLRRAIKLAQITVDTKDDGILGPITLSKINNFDEEKFLKYFTLNRIHFYTSLANKKPKRYGIFLRGWINRAFDSLNFILNEKRRV